MLAKPNLESAVVTARVISRLLRSKELVMADKSDRHHWTEGFHVHRLGCSCTVIVDYYTRLTNIPAARAKCREEREKARVVLAERGYEFDPKYPGHLWINCERAE